MRIRFLLALVGLAISFALPSFAQQTNSPDPELREALTTFNKKVDDGLNSGDAAALAALFTEDAVFVTDQGPIFGRQAIEKKYADVFQQWHPTNYIVEVDKVNAIGNEAWKIGEWSCTLQTKDGPFPIKGYFASIFVRADGAWKERLTCYNMAAETK